MKIFLILLTLLITTQIQSFPFDKHNIKQKIISFVDHILNINTNLANTSCTTSCCASLPSRGAMTYRYYQNTGRFIGGSGAYAINTHGYSGQG
jgi:hypothetical protein